MTNSVPHRGSGARKPRVPDHKPLWCRLDLGEGRIERKREGWMEVCRDSSGNEGKGEKGIKKTRQRTGRESATKRRKSSWRKLG